MIRTVFIIFSAFCFFAYVNISCANDITQSAYKHIILGDKQTRYKISEKKFNNKVLYDISAIGELSASGLYYEKPKILIPHYPILEWSWRVDKMQESADLRIKNKEDFPASIQFIFGSPSIFSRPKILSYAWVSNSEKIGTIIHSPRIPEHFRTIILNNENSELGTFINHSRNIAEDYKRAYGEYPSEEMSAFGVFTDNDQTKEPVTAFYRFTLNEKL